MILNETYTLEIGLSIPKLGLGTWFIDDDQAAEAEIHLEYHRDLIREEGI